MSMSIPGSNCRQNSCCAPPRAGCLLNLPGECVYYSGSVVSGPGINPGDTLNTIVTKITNYITGSISNAPSVIPVKSSDFSIDGITYSNSNLNGKSFEIFLNDINRFIYNEAGNQEWDYTVGGGFQILISGFNANVSDYHLYVFLK